MLARACAAPRPPPPASQPTLKRPARRCRFRRRGRVRVVPQRLTLVADPGKPPNPQLTDLVAPWRAHKAAAPSLVGDWHGLTPAAGSWLLWAYRTHARRYERWRVQGGHRGNTCSAVQARATADRNHCVCSRGMSAAAPVSAGRLAQAHVPVAGSSHNALPLIHPSPCRCCRWLSRMPPGACLGVHWMGL